MAQFFAWNPAVSEDCLTNFWLGSAYCVGVSSSPTSTTASATTTTSCAPTPPAETHAGQPSNCNKWDVVEDGGTEDCLTDFWLGYAYCVGVSES
ncbi:LysM domain-containing protein [Dactylonectria macrodidyma]|uniref:LysM domain-containing protein n=1 Tax=Dactylonectria macrodidyma TaxID=307937 RepID=A0A9P9FQ59_9HYPO|nr:LysM domain-containing protein [Dactylonectria macrodidyma]